VRCGSVRGCADRGCTFAWSAIVLFDGSNLDQFDTFSPSKGMNNDTDHIFTVENGAIHVSGKEYGALVTKQEYANYYLSAEFKWGEGTYAQREGKARDAGILYDVTGPMKIWPSSVEFQIMEGRDGGYLFVQWFCADFTRGESRGWKTGAVCGDRSDWQGPWKDVVGYRDPEGDPENAHGEWNQVELVVSGDRAQYFCEWEVCE